ncbi:SDR family NAD(P)-dependent oxidoreductase [Streptomyces sp. NPDC054796]
MTSAPAAQASPAPAARTSGAPRHVLVTGGGTGIGRAVAARFASRGDRVTVTGRRAAPLEAAAKETGAEPVVCDHTDPEQLAALLERLPARVGVLVNNAGGQTDFGAPGDEGEGGASGLASYARRFRANLEANLITAALTTHALADRLAEGGAVIHLGSIAADKGNGAYGAAKAGLAAWNVGLARELGVRGITANVVAPGYIAETEFFGDALTGERRNQLVADTALKRAGVPEDVAETVAFLASEGGRHITGQVIAVNGGAHSTR